MRIDDIADAIRSEFCARRERNPTYSMRAFARQLAVSSGALSEIMQGKREVGFKLYQHLVSKLGYSANELQKETPSSLQVLSEDEFSLVKDWYHFALQDLLRTKNCNRQPAALARRLGITTSEAMLALKRLQRLGLVRESNSKWYAVKANVTTTVDIPSEVIQAAHRQDLRNAESALYDVDVKRRDFSAITLCFSPRKMKEAKKRIEEFRHSFAKEFDADGGTEIYQLSLYLFPLTKGETATVPLC